MHKSCLRKICFPLFSCIIMMSLLVYLPMTCFGEEETCPMGVDVSPYQVNIDGGGVEHSVRVLTYTWYSNTAGAFVYINENEDAIESEYIQLTRDSVGHLVVKISLEAFQNAGLEADASHLLKIVALLKVPTDDCIEKEGTGDIYIVGKNGKVSN